MVGISRGPGEIACSYRLGNGDLSTGFRHVRERVAEPDEKSGSTDSSHRLASQTSEPKHVGHAVSHLYEGRGYQWHGHDPKIADDAPLCEICYFFIKYVIVQNYIMHLNTLSICTQRVCENMKKVNGFVEKCVQR